MATEILLTSEKFVKGTSNISDNVAGKFLLPCIREAQEVYLKGILGSCLLDAIKSRVADGTIDDTEAEPYKALLDECQYFLAYQSIVLLLPRVTYKVGNFGLSKSSDENLQVVTPDELARQEEFYQSMADARCYDLQGWLYERKEAYPELDECACSRLKSNLYSAATSGIWLGGPRAKRLPKIGGCCK